MAIAGGMTTAYWCRLVDGRMSIERTTYPTQMCAKVEDAIAAMERGERCTVSSADMPDLHARMREKQATA